MDKDFATYQLGNNEETAARWLGISLAIYREWPERLHRVMADRVIAATLRMEHARALGLTQKQYLADAQHREAWLEIMMRRISLAACMAGLMNPPPADLVRQLSKPKDDEAAATATAG